MSKPRTIERGIRRCPPSEQYPKGGYQARANWKGHREEQTFPRIAEARRWRERKVTEWRDGHNFPEDKKKGTELFRDVAEDWRKLIQKRKPNTRAGYESILDFHILPKFGHRRIGTIRTSDIQAFLDTLAEKGGVAPGTVRNVYRVLSPIFRLAVRHERLGKTPCDGIELPSPNSEKELFLTPLEVAALAREIGEPYDFMVKFAAYTGLRAGEVCGLRVRNFDEMNKRVYVEESVSDVNGHLEIVKPKTKSSRRAVALPDPLVKQVAARIAGRGPESHIFTSPRGGILRHNNFMKRHFHPAVQRLVADGKLPKEKAKLRFHDLRHTYVAILVEQRAHPLAIKEQLGHDSITTTLDKYGHLMPRLIEELMGEVGEVYESTA